FGNLYVADYYSNIIRKVTSAGVVTTFVGSPGRAGSADATGTNALFRGPFSVATDAAGNLYVSDSLNNTIRKVTSSGVVTTLAGAAGQFGSGDGTNGVARFSYPAGLAADGSGNIYVSDVGNNTIRKVTADGSVTTVAGFAGQSGSADGPAGSARFFHPTALALDNAGN